MKIGILTFHRAHNYGAILQVYALQELLKEYYDVEIIDYYPKSLHYYHYSECYNVSIFHVKEYVKNKLFLGRRKKRYLAFNNFIENYLVVSPQPIDDINKKYDAIIIGSDQVWNPRNNYGEYDYYYWGRFKRAGELRLISYAASAGKSLKELDWPLVANFLRNFDAISVREFQFRDLLKNKCDINSEWVVDPTMLQDRIFWNKIVPPKLYDKPYLFFYQARRNESAYNYAKKYAKKMKLQFVCLSAHIMLQNDKKVIAADPLDFLSLVKYASYIVTTSFHGTVFCYQFKKDFCCLKLDDGDNDRTESLLSLMGLKDRLICLNQCPNTDEINWEKIESTFTLIRNKSKKWLFNNLGNYEYFI